MDRQYLERDFAFVLVICNAQPFHPDGNIEIDGPPDCLRDLSRDPVPQHTRQPEGHRARRHLEKRRRVPARLQNLHLFVDHDTRRAVARQHDPVGGALQFHVAPVFGEGNAGFVNEIPSGRGAEKST